MKKVIYVHGKGGSADESNLYCKGLDGAIFGVDYDGYLPWNVSCQILDGYNKIVNDGDEVILVANSIGAYFSMLALRDKKIDRAYFISPLVDMEKMIEGMMKWANVSEEDLKIKKEIVTDFGETLSYEYLTYARQNKVVWTAKTCVIFGSCDNLITYETVSGFVNTHNAKLYVMDGGEHWFHTGEQLDFIENVIKMTENECKTDILGGIYG